MLSTMCVHSFFVKFRWIQPKPWRSWIFNKCFFPRLIWFLKTYRKNLTYQEVAYLINTDGTKPTVEILAFTCGEYLTLSMQSLFTLTLCIMLSWIILFYFIWSAHIILEVAKQEEAIASGKAIGTGSKKGCCDIAWYQGPRSCTFPQKLHKHHTLGPIVRAWL